MKKIEKVSIGGISFTLDADAYQSLKSYLDSLHRHYAKDPDGGEITADIEARIAELILDEQVYTRVVGKELVDTIVAQLGSAEQIDDDPETDGAPSWSVGGSGSAGSERIAKRLYRTRSPRILGGVCGGLANYFNINVAWVRVIFLLPLVFEIFFRRFWIHDVVDDLWGVSTLAYVILWIAVPVARTARQNLEARGEKITADSIRQTLNSAAESPTAKRANSVAAEVLIVFGRIVLFFVKFVAACVAFGFVVAGLAVATALVALIFGEGSAMFSGPVFWFPQTFIAVSPWLAGLVMFSVMLPLLMLGFGLLKFVFGWRTGRLGRIVSLSLVGLWIVALFWGLGLLGRNADGFRDVIRQRDFDTGVWRWDEERDGDWDFDFDVNWNDRGNDQEQWRKEIRVVPAPSETAPDSIVVVPVQ